MLHDRVSAWLRLARIFLTRRAVILGAIASVVGILADVIPVEAWLFQSSGSDGQEASHQMVQNQSVNNQVTATASPNVSQKVVVAPPLRDSVILSLEQFTAQLDRREKEVRRELQSDAEADKNKIAGLEKKLEVIERDRRLGEERYQKRVRALEAQLQELQQRKNNSGEVEFDEVSAGSTQSHPHKVDGPLKLVETNDSMFQRIVSANPEEIIFAVAAILTILVTIVDCSRWVRRRWQKRWGGDGQTVQHQDLTSIAPLLRHTVTQEQYKAHLAEKEKELRQQLQTEFAKTDKGTPAGFAKKIAGFITGLAAIGRACARAEEAYQERLKALEAQVQDLQDLGNSVDETTLNDALAALKRGDQHEADELFKQVEEASATSTDQAANAAYQRGLIAENSYDFFAACDHVERAAQLSPDNLNITMAAGRLTNAMGDFPSAQRHMEHLVDLTEREYGDDSPAYATVLNNLAEVYRAQGKYVDAKNRLVRAIEIDEKVLGPGHLNVAPALSNLAGLYFALSDSEAAERLSQRALDIVSKALDPDHPQIAAALCGLAKLRQNQGQYSEAERLYRHALEIQEKTFGPDHPDVASTLNNVGLLCKLQKNYAEARLFYVRARDVFEKALGPNHPEVAISLNNIAALHHAQQEYADAESLYLSAIEIEEKWLGPIHPGLAERLHNLAVLYDEQDWYAEAERRYLRAIGMIEQTLGTGHPHVAAWLNSLAGLYRRQHQYENAASCLQRAIRACELGDNHSDIKTYRNNYEVLMAEMKPPPPPLALSGLR